MFKVKIRSTFALGLTDELRTQMDSGDGFYLEVEQGATVQELLQSFPALGPPEVYDDMMMHVFVNGKLRGFDHVLQDEDVVDLHIPVAGG
jgi:molybdopterin converting factor small subunit